MKLINAIGAIVLGLFVLIILILIFVPNTFKIVNNIFLIIGQQLGFNPAVPGGEDYGFGGLYGSTPSTIPTDAEPERIKKVKTKPGIPVDEKYFGELYSYSREGALVDTIVLHHTGDNKASQTFNTLKKRELSVHYVVDKDGTIYYLIDESTKGAHCGCCPPSNPTCCKAGENCPVCLNEELREMNAKSIGIEIVNTGYADDYYTNEQYVSIDKLINDIASRWTAIAVDNEHVLGHYQITLGKWDPSPVFKWARIQGLSGHLMLADIGKKAPSEYGYT
ncbi:N-acetylmuramoyl-L-alanine amidase [Candidatus Woesearchaeota archaeon]|nr:N-acetylmuramoyl-L-alanine amidase [Candidatus Woesearchaeota archaeon]